MSTIETLQGELNTLETKMDKAILSEKEQLRMREIKKEIKELKEEKMQKNESKQTKECPMCAELVHSKAKICKHCGFNFNTGGFQGDNQNNQSGLPDKNVAGILALFFGGIGAHKFYIGKAGFGLIYLIFCWTGIPLVIGIIEAILYFSCKNSVEFREKYVNNQ